MIFPGFWWIVVIAGALGCALGFVRFIWFMSVGYGMAMSFIGLALGIIGISQGASIWYVLLCAVIFVYGLRLGLFLLVRELKNAAYKKTLDDASGKAAGKMPVPVLLSMWVMNTFLYYMESCGLTYRLASGMAAGTDAFIIIGVIISAAGVIIESVSDAQKSAQKKENPDKVAMKGLFKMCRCPNYFGEILVWTGVFISGMPCYSFGQWIVAIIGYVAIVYIMFNGAKRLETRQTKRCFKDPEYVEYSNKTPILIPFLPIYHLITWIQ